MADSDQSKFRDRSEGGQKCYLRACSLANEQSEQPSEKTKKTTSLPRKALTKKPSKMLTKKSSDGEVKIKRVTKAKEATKTKAATKTKGATKAIEATKTMEAKKTMEAIKIKEATEKASKDATDKPSNKVTSKECDKKSRKRKYQYEIDCSFIDMDVTAFRKALWHQLKMKGDIKIVGKNVKIAENGKIIAIKSTTYISKKCIRSLATWYLKRLSKNTVRLVGGGKKYTMMYK